MFVGGQETDLATVIPIEYSDNVLRENGRSKPGNNTDGVISLFLNLVGYKAKYSYIQNVTIGIDKVLKFI